MAAILSVADQIMLVANAIVANPISIRALLISI